MADGSRNLWDRGEQPVVLPCPREAESVRPSRFRVEVLRVEPGDLAVAHRGKPVDRVGAPAIVKVPEQLPLQAVMVVEHLYDVGEIVRKDILLPWAPFEHELESVPDAEVEDAGGIALQGWVRGAPRDEFAPLLAAHRKGGHDAPHDEYAPEVIQDDPVPSSREEGCHCCEEDVDAVELAKRRAGI